MLKKVQQIKRENSSIQMIGNFFKERLSSSIQKMMGIGPKLYFWTYCQKYNYFPYSNQDCIINTEIAQDGTAYFGYSVATSGFPFVANEKPQYFMKVDLGQVRFCIDGKNENYLLVYYLDQKSGRTQKVYFSFFGSKKVIWEWFVWRDELKYRIRQYVQEIKDSRKDSYELLEESRKKQVQAGQELKNKQIKGSNTEPRVNRAVLVIEDIEFQNLEESQIKIKKRTKQDEQYSQDKQLVRKVEKEINNFRKVEQENKELQRKNENLEQKVEILKQQCSNIKKQKHVLVEYIRKYVEQGQAILRNQSDLNG